MAARTTRNKIKYQSQQIKNHFDHIFEHAKKMEEMADGASDVINANLDVLVKLTVYTKEFWDDLRAKL